MKIQLICKTHDFSRAAHVDGVPPRVRHATFTFPCPQEVAWFLKDKPWCVSSIVAAELIDDQPEARAAK